MIRFVLVLVCLVSAAASAQTGLVDTSFGTDGLVVGLAEARPIRLADLAVSATDEAVYVGWSGRDETQAFVGRVTPEGLSDVRFGDDGRAVISVVGSGETLRAVAIRANGQIVAAGQASTDGSTTDLLVVQLDAAGRDETVTVLGLGESARGEGVAVTDAGAFVAVSLFDSQRCAIVGLDASGALDPTFGVEGRLVLPTASPCEAADLVRTERGVALVGTLTEGTGRVVLAQVTLDGALDRGFGVDGVAIRDFASSQNKASSLAVGPGGGLIVGGLSRKGTTAGPLLLRFDASGTPLDAFGYQGLYWSATAPSQGLYAEPPGVAALPDGRVVFATTTAPTIRLTVGSVTTGGERDLAFGTDGFTRADDAVSAYSYGRAIAVDSQGRVLVGGEAIVEGGTQRLVLSRLTAGVSSTPTDAAPIETGALRIAPNPTVGRTRIRLDLAQPATVQAAVLDSLGRHVATLHEGDARSGDLDLDWDATNAAPGLYVVRLLVDGVPATRTVTVAR